MKSSAKYIIPTYLQNSIDPITVAIVGTGGTGSEFIRKFASIAYTLNRVRNLDMKVTVWDPDKISKANCGRQLFSHSDIGRFKSDVMVERINKFYSMGWKSEPEKFDPANRSGPSNIVISCVDNIKSRMEIRTIVNNHRDMKYGNREHKNYLWIDTGNDFNKGNVIMDGVPDIHGTKLPGVLDIFGGLNDIEEDNTPSCSLAEAISQQHIMINTFVANVACTLIYEVLTQSYIEWSGAFINLESLKISKIPIGYYDKVNSSANSEQRAGADPIAELYVTQ